MVTVWFVDQTRRKYQIGPLETKTRMSIEAQRVQEAQNANSTNVESLFVGGGEVGALMEAIDWSQSPLGPVSSWPQSLRTAVSICLHSRFELFLWWGPDLVVLYNDAYRQTLQRKHPWALGKPGRVVWAEIWPVIGPMLENVMRTGEATWSTDLLLFLERYGYPEETYHTFSYSPIIGEEGHVAGVFTAVTQTTEKVISERQLALLHELAARAADARTWQHACEVSAESLATDPKDLCFALIYIFDPAKQTFVLAGTSGIEPGLPASPLSVRIADASTWPLAEVLSQHDITSVPGIDTRFTDLPSDTWDRTPHTAAVVPIAPSGPTGRSGALVVGLNPYRQLNDGYRGFLKLVAGQISASIANAQAYEEARQRAEALAEIDRAKTIFFSNVSHEFRTPLTLMLGPVEDMLRDRTQPVPEAHAQRLELVHRNSLRLLKLVNTLLDFSRIEAGRVQAKYEPTDLSSVTEELSSMFRSATERAGLKLVVDCKPLSEAIYVDREMWEKIVFNLLSNALKSTFAGEIRVAVDASDGHFVLTVADTGTGIPEDEIPHLFERFRRIEGARRRTHEGSGIGLALVSELVRMHGGSIDVESKLHEGSTFRVRLPLGHTHLATDQISGASVRRQISAGAAFYVQEAMSWLPGHSTQFSDSIEHGAAVDVPLPLTSPTRGRGGKTARLLVVDDNRDMRDYLRELLSPEFEVEIASNGRIAFERAKASLPDLVVSDVMMPEMDGMQLLTALRQESSTATIPLILVSARAGEEPAIEGMEAGADDYVVKPFTARELIARVHSHIKIARYRQKAYEIQAQLRTEMEEARRQALAALENISDGFWLIDSDWCIQYLNSAAVDLGRISREGVTGKTLWELYPQLRGTEAERQYTKAMEERVPVEFEFFFEPWSAYFANRVYPSPDNGIAIYSREISEAKKAEDALRKAEKLAVAGRMAASIAHEINNPLEAVTNLVYIARNDATISPQARAFLEAAERELARLSQIANKTLRFYRQSSSATRVKLADVLDSVVLLFDNQLKQKNIKVIRRVDRDASLLCLVGEIQQVFTNLVSNAIDSMQRDGKLLLSVRKGKGWSKESTEGIRVSIGDTGTGMAPEIKKRLFEPFVTTKGEGGTGLGLWVSREILDRHGARVRVRSREGSGTTFSVFFPENAINRADSPKSTGR